MTTSGDLHRTTVNLIPKTYDALVTAAELSRDTRTDTINRAVQAYAYLLQAIAGGDTILVRPGDGGELQKLLFL